jgi:hypothetical protein
LGLTVKSAAVSSDRSRIRKVCGGCATGYDDAAWERLEPHGAIEHHAAKAVVIGFPDNAVVDLRRCASCNTVLAMLRTVE